MSDPVLTYHTAPNGLRIVHHRAPEATVDYCGVMVNVGARDESPDKSGLAHFVEHTIFKGTRHRKAWHISNRMEAVGGELNAYTTKEETVVYTIAPRHNIIRSIELIGDLITNSIFPTPEIDRERDVVADEINSYLDSPADAVYDDFEDTIFAGSGLGHNILGTVESLSHLDSECCRRYLEQFYTPRQMVVFYSGAENPERIFTLVERSRLGTLCRRDTPRDRTSPSIVTPFEQIKEIGSHQSHTIIGARVPGRLSPQRFAVALLCNILGGPGMNSMLNLALRERRGLVYSIDASTALYTDCGIMTIYFGCDRDDVNRCRHLIGNILTDLATSPLSQHRFDMARKQYLGQMIVASESREQSILGIARATMLTGAALGQSQISEIINALTPGDLLNAGTLIAPSMCSTLTFY